MPKSRFAAALFAGLLLAAGSPALLAEPKDKDGHPPQKHSQHENRANQGQQGQQGNAGRQPAAAPSQGDVRAGHDQIRVTIGGSRDYWRPGPALPPGVRQNLQRGKPLPPGIARQQLDSRLVSRLPYREGHEWLRVGTDLVQVSISTRVINDVLSGAFD